MVFLSNSRYIPDNELYLATTTFFHILSNYYSVIIPPFQLHYGPGVDLVSNRNEYQEMFLKEYSWGVKKLPERRADNLTAIYEPFV
jgi:hypothetical protein